MENINTKFHESNTEMFEQAQRRIEEMKNEILRITEDQIQQVRRDFDNVIENINDRLTICEETTKRKTVVVTNISEHMKNARKNFSKLTEDMGRHGNRIRTGMTELVDRDINNIQSGVNRIKKQNGNIGKQVVKNERNVRQIPTRELNMVKPLINNIGNSKNVFNGNINIYNSIYL